MHHKPETTRFKRLLSDIALAAFLLVFGSLPIVFLLLFVPELQRPFLMALVCGIWIIFGLLIIFPHRSKNS